jgi:hypothetical protein
MKINLLPLKMLPEQSRAMKSFGETIYQNTLIISRHGLSDNEAGEPATAGANNAHSCGPSQVVI